jgi:hypothetical protein
MNRIIKERVAGVFEFDDNITELRLINTSGSTRIFEFTLADGTIGTLEYDTGTRYVSNITITISGTSSHDVNDLLKYFNDIIFKVEIDGLETRSIVNMTFISHDAEAGEDLYHINFTSGDPSPVYIKSGVPGPVGPQGGTGANGEDGSDGVDGADGKSFLSGTGIPTSGIGNDGDSYLDNSSRTVYRKSSGAWSVSFAIPAGADGIDGTNGTNGTNGSDGNDGRSISSVSLSNTTENHYVYTITYDDSTSSQFQIPIPSDGVDGADGSPGATGASGSDGDDGVSITGVSFKETTTTDHVYEVTYSDSSTSTFSIPVPEDGADGTNGTNGLNGADGADGSSLITFPFAPTDSNGNDGDSWIDISTYNLYGKSGGSWSLLGNIKGANGADGADGAQGDAGPQGIQGPQGEQGPAGADGSDGTPDFTISSTAPTGKADGHLWLAI